MGITTTSLTHLHASLFDSVRRIRAEALDLLETTDDIITTLNDTSLAENDVQMRVQRALMIGNKIISEHGPQVQKYFEAINILLAQHPELNIQSGEDVSSDITIMCDEWEKALWNWPNTTEGNSPSKQELLFQLGEVDGQVMGVYLKSVIPEVPEFDDRDNRLQWKFRASRAQGTVDDEISVAFG